MNRYKKMEKTIKSAKKSMKKAGRQLSGKILAAVTLGAVLPFEMRRVRGGEDGDDAIIFDSLLFSTTIYPKNEDSLAGKTTVSVRLRTPCELGRALKGFGTLLAKPGQDSDAE